MSNTLAWLGLALILGSAFALTKALFFPGAWALLPVLGAVALLRAGPAAWVNRRILASRPMVAVGLISYPLYLWHWPLLSFAAIVYGGAASAGVRLAAVALALALSWLTWRYLERPVRYGAHKAAVVAGLVLAMLLVGLAGYALRANDGAEQRFPLSASQATYDKWTWGANPECTARYPGLQGIPYCLLGPDAPPEVALIGDSHANQYYPGLLEQGLKVINLGKGSCVPLLNVTTHIPLSEVSAHCTREAVAETGRLLHEALRKSGIASPRIGVAGLNPHAGEHGLFGREEIEAIDPAVTDLVAEGIQAVGSLPADVVFPQLKAGIFDGVVSLYHDQGHPVMKTLGFDLKRGILRGVNVTLGLPIVRTSPDHGTGFDIAWRMPGDDSSLRDALRLARRMTR